jgi:hypothetical protein
MGTEVSEEIVRTLGQGRIGVSSTGALHNEFEKIPKLVEKAKPNAEGKVWMTSQQSVLHWILPMILIVIAQKAAHTLATGHAPAPCEDLLCLPAGGIGRVLNPDAELRLNRAVVRSVFQ